MSVAEHIRELAAALVQRHAEEKYELQRRQEEEFQSIQDVADKFNVKLDETYITTLPFEARDERPMIRRVFDVLTGEKYFTVDQICEELQADVQEVRNALYSQRMRRILDKSDIDGRAAYRITNGGSLNDPPPKSGVSESIRNYFEFKPTGRTQDISRYVADALDEPYEEIYSKVSATLSSMKRRNNILHNPETSLYALPENEEFAVELHCISGQLEGAQ